MSPPVGVDKTEWGPTEEALSGSRITFLARLALANNGGSESGAKVFGEFVKLGVAVNLDGLFGGIANYIAVVAPSQMLFQLRLGRGVNYAVEVIRQFVEKFRALHWLPSPLIGFCDPFVFSLSRPGF